MAPTPSQPGDKHKDQQHPLWSRDRQVVERLLQEEASDYNLAELARLLMRYAGFPGAWDIQSNLAKALERWQLSETSLYEKTRQIHASGQVYRGRGSKRDDWN